MAKTRVTSKLEAQPRERRSDWVGHVTALVNQIADWSTAEGWKVERHEKSITEEALGTYPAPEIVVRLKDGELIVTPIALHVAGGEGRVDLEAIPTLARVKLLRVNGKWKPFADPNVPLRLAWNQANFTQLAQDLLR